MYVIIIPQANAICYIRFLSVASATGQTHGGGGWTRRAAESAVAGGRNRREDAYVCAITPPTDLAYIDLELYFNSAADHTYVPVRTLVVYVGGAGYVPAARTQNLW